MFKLLFLALACLALLQLVSANHELFLRDAVLTPDDDPFYKPPKGWENEKPGAILRSRKINIALLQVLNYKYNEGHQLLYRTTGAEHDEPSYTVTTIIVPHNAKKNKLIDYNVYTDANGPQCVASYGLRRGGKIGTDVIFTYQQVLLTTMLDEGYILTIPDYQGPTHGFGVGRMAGRMSVDGVRATLNYRRLGLSKNTKVVGYGYSGGAIATGWAASLQPKYAPELNMVGWSMGGTPANLTSTVLALDRGLFSGFAVAGVTGILDTFPSVQKWAKDRLQPKGKKEIAFARKHCMLDVLLAFPFNNLQSNEFVTGGPRILYEPAVTAVTHKLNMGVEKDETPTAPVYIYHGHHDEVIPYADAHAAAQRWGKHGADVKFGEMTDLLLGHITTELTNLPNVILFIRDRMSGKAFPKGYTHTRMGNPLEDPRVLGQGFKSLANTLNDFILETIGYRDSKLVNRIKEHSD